MGLVGAGGDDRRVGRRPPVGADGVRAGDSFLNLGATTLPLDAYLVTGDAK